MDAASLERSVGSGVFRRLRDADGDEEEDDKDEDEDEDFFEFPFESLLLRFPDRPLYALSFSVLLLFGLPPVFELPPLFGLPNNKDDDDLVGAFRGLSLLVFDDLLICDLDLNSFAHSPNHESV